MEIGLGSGRKNGRVWSMEADIFFLFALPLMNNKTEAAVFPCKPCVLGAFLFLSLIYLYCIKMLACFFIYNANIPVTRFLGRLTFKKKYWLNYQALVFDFYMQVQRQKRHAMRHNKSGETLPVFKKALKTYFFKRFYFTSVVSLKKSSVLRVFYCYVGLLNFLNYI